MDLRNDADISFPLHLLSKEDLVKNLDKIVLQSKVESRKKILMQLFELHPTIFQQSDESDKSLIDSQGSEKNHENLIRILIQKIEDD